MSWHPVKWPLMMIERSQFDPIRPAITICPRVGWFERILYWFKDLGE